MENRKLLTKGRIIIGLLILWMVAPTVWLGIRSVQNGNQWLYFHSEGRSGRVVEADTGAPVEGAVVIAAWRTGHMIGGPHPIMFIFWLNPLYHMGDSLAKGFGSEKIIVTATDKDGKFDIPAWSAFRPWAYNDDGSEDPHFCIYKPGYKTLWSYGGRWMMNEKELKIVTKDLPLTKSLTAKEIKEDFKVLCVQGFNNIEKNERLKIAGFIEDNLKKLPIECAKEITEYLYTD
jgi:hypothetical protein